LSNSNKYLNPCNWQYSFTVDFREAVILIIRDDRF
jgi:hypothetical protein